MCFIGFNPQRLDPLRWTDASLTSSLGHEILLRRLHQDVFEADEKEVLFNILREILKFSS